MEVENNNFIIIFYISYLFRHARSLLPPSATYSVKAPVKVLCRLGHLLVVHKGGEVLLSGTLTIGREGYLKHGQDAIYSKTCFVTFSHAVFNTRGEQYSSFPVPCFSAPYELKSEQYSSILLKAWKMQGDEKDKQEDYIIITVTVDGEDKDEEQSLCCPSDSDKLRLANRDHPRRAIRQGGARDAS